MRIGNYLWFQTVQPQLVHHCGLCFESWQQKYCLGPSDGIVTDEGPVLTCIDVMMGIVNNFCLSDLSDR